MNAAPSFRLSYAQPICSSRKVRSQGWIDLMPCCVLEAASTNSAIVVFSSKLAAMLLGKCTHPRLSGLRDTSSRRIDRLARRLPSG